MADLRLLPAPRVAEWAWQFQAACRGIDTSVFFHPDNERGPARIQRELQAKAICARCLVRDECLRSALMTRESYGVWGGTSPEDREALLARRPA
jgi:WhiB family redox-sensing transcriptional regulator